jgi:two-component system nitrogen regulation response regulator GlnG
LFGYERGAFTGAECRKPGKFEQACGGTIFLDEIADMTPATQAKVLRVLQEQRFERVGGSETIETNSRVIAATNQSLEGLVAQGRFRHDLFYRLNVFTITLPPLRDRLDDMPLLIDHFVRMFQRQLGRRVRMVTPEAVALLKAYKWPGNVRELQSAIKYAIVHATGEILTEDCLPDYFRTPNAGLADYLRLGGTTSSDSRTAPLPPGEYARIGLTSPSDYVRTTEQANPLLGQSLQIAGYVQALLRDTQDDLHRRVHGEVDRVLIDEVLRHVHGNQHEAAEMLGISRTTLRAKLRSLGLAVEKQVLPDSVHGGQQLPGM